MFWKRCPRLFLSPLLWLHYGEKHWLDYGGYWQNDVTKKGDKFLEVKKTSCAIPGALWVKYKTYELEQVKQGNHVSLNGLIVALLIEKLKTY